MFELTTGSTTTAQNDEFMNHQSRCMPFAVQQTLARTYTYTLFFFFFVGSNNPAFAEPVAEYSEARPAGKLNSSVDFLIQALLIYAKQSLLERKLR